MKKLFYSLPVVFATPAIFAQSSGNGITIPSDFQNIGWSDFVTTLAGSLAPAILAMLGLAAGVFLVRYIWRSMKSISR